MRLLLERRQQFALLITVEMGKPLDQARAEVNYAADFLRWFAEEASRLPGTFGTIPDRGTRMVAARGPVGPCLLITPWNFSLPWPLATSARLWLQDALWC